MTESGGDFNDDYPDTAREVHTHYSAEVSLRLLLVFSYEQMNQKEIK